MIDLREYDAAVKDRERNEAAMDGVLYDLCKGLPGHRPPSARGPTPKRISYQFIGRNLMTCLGGWCMLPASTPDGFKNSGRCVNVFR